jgi:ketosteroid isomerase-like protein
MKKLAGCLAALLIVFAVSMIAQPKKTAGGDEAALKAIEEKWEVASVKADVATLGAILADTFVSTNADGHVQTKAEMLAALKSGDVKFEKSDVDEMKVQVYGNAAVIMGRWSGKVIEKGTPAESVERFTDTFIKQGGHWKCVASHSSPIH